MTCPSPPPRREPLSSCVATHRVVLVGDSDVERWPPEHLPFRRRDHDDVLIGVVRRRTTDGEPAASRACDDDDGDNNDSNSNGHSGEEEGPPVQGRNRFPRRDDESGGAAGALLDRHPYRFEVVDVRGTGGATMNDVMKVVRASIGEWLRQNNRTENCKHDGGDVAGGRSAEGRLQQQQLFMVACAGENDLGQGKEVDEIVKDWSSLVATVEDEARKTPSFAPSSSVSVVLLGPKLEPWLTHDVVARRSYIRLSRALEANCALHLDLPAHQRPPDTQSSSGDVRVHFVDCLTAFCTPETAHVRGALLGGRALPDVRYFDADQLHLSDAGYRLWRQTLENVLKRLVMESS